MSGLQAPRAKIVGGLAAGLGALGLACPALAQDLRVAVSCPSWPSEQASQVEARVRAALLLEEPPPRDVQVSCSDDAVQVEVEAAGGRVARGVRRSLASSLEDDIVREVDLALRELKLAAASVKSAPVPSRTTDESTAPVASAPVPPPPATRVAAPPLSPSRAHGTPNWLEVRGSGGLERWAGHWAVGAELVPSFGGQRIRYGIALGGASALREPEAFDASAWHAALELSWQPSFAGARVALQLGASLLSATPGSGVSAQSSTAYAAGFLQLAVSRPIALGPLALAPELALRAYGAERDVQVNGAERLRLPFLVPRVGLSLLWSGRVSSP